ncbi:hypothetical protein RHGRI_001668 [Rhododendron griersonianum]|uniref:Uncharacterized protein n=1 Tax=Rhododendron griersonianum TaxID=479676 RepID=A0AAV6LPZ8_9ERIC|nr:hypothetical protein RHGRI_001668 [Rhododendron griersonianum]
MILFHGLNWTRWEQIVNNTPLPRLTSFVEDRLATLKNVIKEPELDGWSLYLGDWGYNTQKERAEAASIPRIHLLQLSDFSKKLK